MSSPRMVSSLDPASAKNTPLPPLPAQILPNSPGSTLSTFRRPTAGISAVHPTSNPLDSLFSMSDTNPPLENPGTPTSYLESMMSDLHLMYQAAKNAGAHAKDDEPTCNFKFSELDDIYGYYSDPNDDLMARNRARAAMELVSTEVTYVEMLIVLVECVIVPLRDSTKRSGNAKKISAEDLRALFGNVEQILGLHRILLAGLQERSSMWTNEQIFSDIFISMIPYFKMYIKYMGDYSNALEVLSKCRKSSPEFSKFIDNVQTTPRFKGQQLLSLMIMPIQRVPRYIMLLQQLLSFTPASHPDFNGLNHCLAEIKHIADHINEAIRQVEHNKKVAELQNKLSGRPSSLASILQPTRFFIDQIDCYKPGKNQSKRLFILCNDLVILAKKINDEKFEYKDEIPIENDTWLSVLSDDADEFIFHIGNSRLRKTWSLATFSSDALENLCSLYHAAETNLCNKRRSNPSFSSINNHDSHDFSNRISSGSNLSTSAFSKSNFDDSSEIINRHSFNSSGDLHNSFATTKRRSASALSSSSSKELSNRSSLPPPRRESMNRLSTGASPVISHK